MTLEPGREEKKAKFEARWNGPPEQAPAEMLQEWTQDLSRSKASLSYRLGYRNPQIVSLTREKVVGLMLEALPELEKAVARLPEGKHLLDLARGSE